MISNRGEAARGKWGDSACWLGYSARSVWYAARRHTNPARISMPKVERYTCARCVYLTRNAAPSAKDKAEWTLLQVVSLFVFTPSLCCKYGKESCELAIVISS